MCGRANLQGSVWHRAAVALYSAFGRLVLRLVLHCFLEEKRSEVELCDLHHRGPHSLELHVLNVVIDGFLLPYLDKGSMTWVVLGTAVCPWCGFGRLVVCCLAQCTLCATQCNMRLVQTPVPIKVIITMVFALAQSLR